MNSKQNAKINLRIVELEAEFAKGQQRLTALRAEISVVESTMQRLTGARTMLAELHTGRLFDRDASPVAEVVSPAEPVEA